MTTPSAQHFRLGIDLGGTKIAAAILDPAGVVRHEARGPAPRNDYGQTIRAIADLVADMQARLQDPLTVGVGMPGSLSPRTGRVQNSNSTWLNGSNFKADLETAVGQPIRCANDANCFALSEAIDGAGSGARCVFGVILGTGTGGGVVVDRSVVDGPRGSGGEWGHTPLPWTDDHDRPQPTCWCGRQGCLEAWLSGPAIARTYAERSGRAASAEEIVQRAETSDDPLAEEALQRHAHRLARGLAMICNILDPDVIVLGGGLSQMPHLYTVVPDMMAPYLFADTPTVELRPPRWGDAGGVRGAAWLWGGPPCREREKL